MSDIHYFGDTHLYWIARSTELEALLKGGGFHLLSVSHHVPIDYTESTLDEFIKPYETLYNLLSAGEKLTWNEHWSLFPRYSPTRDISRCVYGDEHTYRGKRYKTADCDYRDRCVGMQPFILFKEMRPNGIFSISKTYFHGQMPENAVGVHFWCPTKRQILENGEPVISLTDSPEYIDFLFIRDHIRQFTKPLKIQAEERIVHTGIYVSNAAKQDIGNFYFFRHNEITIL